MSTAVLTPKPGGQCVFELNGVTHALDSYADAESEAVRQLPFTVARFPSPPIVRPSHRFSSPETKKRPTASPVGRSHFQRLTLQGSDVMTIEITTAAVPANLRRKDGTPITPTCTIPLKPCCGGVVLLGDECDCCSDEVDAVFGLPIVLDLRATVDV